jgi:hydrogenase/urease accessory protein HupE
VELFVLILVAIVVAQTWFDWGDTKKGRSVPDWGKGLALGGLIAVSLAASSGFASVWIREEAGDWTDGLGSPRFWLELSCSLAMLGILVYGIRKKRLRLTLLLGCALIAAMVLGMAL